MIVRMKRPKTGGLGKPRPTFQTHRSLSVAVTFRFGLGRFNTEEEVDYVIKTVVDKVKKLRELSPLYEMAQQGIDLKSITWAAH